MLEGYIPTGYSPVAVRGKFTEYTLPEHPLGFEKGGLWLEINRSTGESILRARKLIDRKGASTREFERITPQRARWLTGVDFAVDSYYSGEVGVDIINPNSVEAVLALDANVPSIIRRHCIRGTYTLDRKILAEVNDRRGKPRHHTLRERTIDARYVTVSYGKYIRILPVTRTIIIKDNGDSATKEAVEFVLRVYPTHPL